MKTKHRHHKNLKTKVQTKRKTVHLGGKAGLVLIARSSVDVSSNPHRIVPSESWIAQNASHLRHTKSRVDMYHSILDADVLTWNAVVTGRYTYGQPGWRESWPLAFGSGSAINESDYADDVKWRYWKALSTYFMPMYFGVTVAGNARMVCYFYMPLDPTLPFKPFTEWEDPPYG